MTKLIVANWKMNPETISEAKEIVSKIKTKIDEFTGVKLVICPPFTFLSEIGKSIKNSKKIVLGAQDIFIGQGFSHTGEVSGEMIKDLGAKYVIVGHSERRENGDTDDIVSQKLLGSLKKGLKVILCVGEKERNERGEYFAEIKRQIVSATGSVSKDFVKNIIIAYEPIWAIGKSDGEAITPEKLGEMTIFIKKVLNDLWGRDLALKVLVLYGGSVSKKNAKELLSIGHVGGLLIGRESLKTENFLELLKEV